MSSPYLLSLTTEVCAEQGPTSSLPSAPTLITSSKTYTSPEDSSTMGHTEEEGNYNEEKELPPRPDVPASFTGRLNLASYAFSPNPKTKKELTPSPRSPRNFPSMTSSPTLNPKRKLEDLTPSPSPKKKSKSPAGYAPPSTYAHLPELRDVLEPNLICVFIGLNPGITTVCRLYHY
jgi:hypothetical protein